MATLRSRPSYLGLALTSLGFQTVQMDVGRLTRVLPQDGWRPELNANFGGNLLISLRDGAVRSYPHLGNQLVWKRWSLPPLHGP